MKSITWFTRPSRLVVAACLPFIMNACSSGEANTGSAQTADSTAKPKAEEKPAVADVTKPALTLDTALFDRNNTHLANGDSSGKWPVKTAYPNPGAVLPYKRIVAYYGNLYSKNMGVLGEYPPDEMLQKLGAEVKKWEAADPAMPVQPALHYIAVTAQGAPGRDGKYRLRMPFKQIDSILGMAARINALVFLDVQVGFSNVQAEIPLLEQYLKLPHVHLGIDPEFSMKTGKRPGSVIGTMDAADVNFVSDYLANLAKANNLPPKILVVHRFTQNMVTNYKNIKTNPNVQIVMDMDGWGEPSLKHDSYKAYVWREPVQFAGFKLFYKNDIRKQNSHMLTPQEVLAEKPQPVYIQYQ
ncbi:hypothetical protein A4H97_11845 [Niastella yeongjuensis]|uniref:Lipoprotein n=1 Tax=Niastella yeongjuensis TaxID=354355 RepID=A0A1V9E9P4_9BACT|nr:hypothetical protein [Niastella yeongjuensis]OQP42843.1 hypothetical protein A4H97_11845 [Niastella yeongjuensis]SEO56392.1 hypothetical protein SAMN05660816_03035 [Niastella yeongjuensis]